MANIERLRELRRVVEAAPEDRFRMSSFSQEGPCGTAYCAAGWAALDPWFRANTPITKLLEVQPDGGLILRGGADLQEIFDINYDDEHNLFYPDSDNVTKAQVLMNVDRLIRGHETVSLDDDDYDDDSDDDDDTDFEDEDDDEDEDDMEDEDDDGTDDYDDDDDDVKYENDAIDFANSGSFLEDN